MSKISNHIVSINSEMAPRLSLAVVTTVCFRFSHSDVIVSRWNVPRKGDEEWGWATGRSKIISMYVDQHPDNDNSREIAEAQQIELYPDIEAALTLGSGRIMVDGVLLIAEHGEYPTDERGVKHYPRKQFFDEILRVSELYGQKVSIFCDKHLSWRDDWAHQMVQSSWAKGNALTAGSNICFADVEPSFPKEILLSAEESLSIFGTALESYFFHSMEGALSLLEQRKDGERGVVAMRVLSGAVALDELTRRSGIRELLEKSIDESYVSISDFLEEIEDRAVLISLKHDGGLFSHYLYTDKLCEPFRIAIRGGGEIHIGTYLLGDDSNYYAHFATLNRVIEDSMCDANLSSSIDRPLLATLITARAMDMCRDRDQSSYVDVADLKIAYTPKTSFRLSRRFLIGGNTVEEAL